MAAAVRLVHMPARVGLRECPEPALLRTVVLPAQTLGVAELGMAELAVAVTLGLVVATPGRV